jgi:hypothetical protein
MTSPMRLAPLMPLQGRWAFADDTARYLGPAEGAQIPHGLAVGPGRLRRGQIRTRVRFDDDVTNANGRLVIGFNAETGSYFSAGLGGYGFAYVLDEFLAGRGWRMVKASGLEKNLSTGVDYDLLVEIRGQYVTMSVDGVRVLQGTLPYPMTDDQVGLMAFGQTQVTFEAPVVNAGPPQAFVVMQFGEPYDSLYASVIKPTTEGAGLSAHRADDVYKPGIVLQDIIRGIEEAEVIIAEITPPNANVFYELGYAHAMKKETILLAERGRELPFDIRSYRVIFYDNTIRGKGDVETQLRKHLHNIVEGRNGST